MIHGKILNIEAKIKTSKLKKKVGEGEETLKAAQHDFEGGIPCRTEKDIYFD